MKLTFVSPTNRMCIVDDNDRIDISPVTTVWLWKKSWNCYIKVHSEDYDRLNDLEVLPQIPGKDYATGSQVYLKPAKDKDIMINMNIPYPERVLLTRVDVNSLFENASRTIWVRRTPVGICFVDNGKELIVPEDTVKVLGPDDVLRPILEVYCDLDRWDKYVVRYRESYRDIIIENIEFGLQEDSKESKFTSLMAEFIFGRKSFMGDIELNVAYVVTMVVGKWNIDRWAEDNRQDAIYLLKRILSNGIPNGTGGYMAMRDIETIVSLLEGQIAVKYVQEKSADVLRDCQLKEGGNGKLYIFLSNGVKLSDIANGYYKGTPNNALSDLMHAASIS